jgi:hypothetical protein
MDWFTGCFFLSYSGPQDKKLGLQPDISKGIAGLEK